jgi:hypothetical protein
MGDEPAHDSDSGNGIAKDGADATNQRLAGAIPR